MKAINIDFENKTFETDSGETYPLMFDIDDTITIPFLFTHICELDCKDFNSLLREVFANTKKGNETIRNLVKEIKHNRDYSEFIQNIQQKNIDTSLISDGYFTPEELDDSIIM